MARSPTARSEFPRAAGRRVASLAPALLFPAAARADVPMTYLRTFGGFKGQQITTLTWALLIQAIVVVVIVSLLVLVGIILRRSRQPATGPDRQPVEETGSGLSWIYIGVGVSTVALIGSMVWNGYTMAAIDRPQRDPALTIEVRGHQWWWEVRYMSQDSSRIFETANEIHIPVGQPVEFRVSTVDVIHSFWIPALGDKIDLIPNQINSNWLEASSPGIYRGQCSEYCGQQHAHMGLVVVADQPADFQAWWDRQLQPAAAAQGPEGENLFVLRCGACHAIRGTRAGGRLGPNLSHLMGRQSIAAGTLPNNVAYLSGWIANPQTVKPGNLMPNLDLSGPELAGIRTYLEAQK
ncbi:cytochrome c oxidase subunit II [Microvirga sp. 2TAF3]|uniref:cytochrome c oxidase subunit II n=1 Tax=Microvirga sp. 2TAF3 TaxID=3233014 RepID=UPI003F9D70BE